MLLGKFGQYTLSSGRLPLGGFRQHRQAKAIEQHFLYLLGRSDVEGAIRLPVSVRLQGLYALAKLRTLTGKHAAIHLDTGALNS